MKSILVTPTFITISMGGMGNDGRHRVTKMDYRFLHTLDNIGNAPEPNLTVLWTDRLPYNFRHYCMEMSHKHSSINMKVLLLWLKMAMVK